MEKEATEAVDGVLQDVEATVDGFTVSYSFDIYQSGAKSSNFVSMSFKTSRPVTPQEALLLEVAHSFTVTSATIYNALARGQITTEVANDLIVQSRERHTAIRASLVKKHVKETSGA